MVKRKKRGCLVAGMFIIEINVRDKPGNKRMIWVKSDQ